MINIVLFFWNVFCWAIFVLVFAAWYPIVFAVFVLTRPFDRSGYLVNCVFGAWGRFLVFLQPGWTYQMLAREKLPRSGKVLFVVNHQSHLDGMLVYTLFRPFSVVSKFAVLWAPLAGWCLMLTRPILLSRGSKKSVARMRKKLSRRLNQGVPVLLFPEGTRSVDGQIQQFQRGAFSLAVSENCPIYPVLLDGSARGLPRDSPFLRLRADIRFKALDPVYPQRFSNVQGAAVGKHQQILAMRDHVQNLMKDELARMRAQDKA